MLPAAIDSPLRKVVLASANRGAFGKSGELGRMNAIRRSIKAGGVPQSDVWPGFHSSYYSSKLKVNTMNTKLQRLVQLNSILGKVITFDINIDDDPNKNRLTPTLGTAGTVAGIGGLGAAGLYAAGARRQGVQWGNMGAKVARDWSRGGITGPGGLGSTFMRGADVAGQAAGQAGSALLSGAKTAASGIGEAGMDLLKKIRA